MLFSIITVTRNHRDGLKRTAASVTAQTFRDFEWIVIDGASTDGTIDDFAAYPAQIVSEADLGPYDAMNKGVDRARGDYLIFMNAGDVFAYNDSLQKIAHATRNSPDFIYGDALEIVDEKPVLKPARSHEKIPRGMFTHHQAMIYKRAAIGSLRYDLNYKIAADYDFTLRFLLQRPTVSYLNQPLCIFESGGLSQLNAGLGRSEQFKIRSMAKSSTFVANCLIYARQMAALILRTYCTRFYWTVRRLR